MAGGCKPPTVYTNLFVTLAGHTQADSDAKLSKAWSSLFSSSSSGAIYFDGPGSDESYVKDIYNGDVRTEGMSYGMMIAVQMNKKREFDALWNWSKTYMLVTEPEKSIGWIFRVVDEHRRFSKINRRRARR